MADNETIADIIAEKRARADELEASSYKPHQFLRERIAELRQEADRLDAARERERENYDAKIADLQSRVKQWTDRSAELVKKCDEQYAKLKQVGNAAKLREAIEDLFAKGCVSRHDRVAVCPPCIDNEGYSPSNEWCARCSSDVKEKCMAIYNARAALAEPPRNCDRFGGDIDKLREACARERGLNPEEDFPDVFPDWLLAPATEKEGGAK